MSRAEVKIGAPQKVFSDPQFFFQTAAPPQWAKIQNFVQKLKITGFYFFLFSQSKNFKGKK
jgi:hypothetical protein